MVSLADFVIYDPARIPFCPQRVELFNKLKLARIHVMCGLGIRRECYLMPRPIAGRYTRLETLLTHPLRKAISHFDFICCYIHAVVTAMGS